MTDMRDTVTGALLPRQDEAEAATRREQLRNEARKEAAEIEALRGRERANALARRRARYKRQERERQEAERRRKAEQKAAAGAAPIVSHRAPGAGSKVPHRGPNLDPPE